MEGPVKSVVKAFEELKNISTKPKDIPDTFKINKGSTSALASAYASGPQSLANSQQNISQSVEPQENKRTVAPKILQNILKFESLSNTNINDTSIKGKQMEKSLSNPSTPSLVSDHPSPIAMPQSLVLDALISPTFRKTNSMHLIPQNDNLPSSQRNLTKPDTKLIPAGKDTVKINGHIGSSEDSANDSDRLVKPVSILPDGNDTVKVNDHVDSLEEADNDSESVIEFPSEGEVDRSNLATPLLTEKEFVNAPSIEISCFHSLNRQLKKCSPEMKSNVSSNLQTDNEKTSLNISNTIETDAKETFSVEIQKLLSKPLPTVISNFQKLVESFHSIRHFADEINQLYDSFNISLSTTSRGVPDEYSLDVIGAYVNDMINNLSGFIALANLSDITIPLEKYKEEYLAIKNNLGLEKDNLLKHTSRLSNPGNKASSTSSTENPYLNSSSTKLKGLNSRVLITCTCSITEYCRVNHMLLINSVIEGWKTEFVGLNSLSLWENWALSLDGNSKLNSSISDKNNEMTLYLSEHSMGKCSSSTGLSGSEELNLDASMKSLSDSSKFSGKDKEKDKEKTRLHFKNHPYLAQKSNSKNQDSPSHFSISQSVQRYADAGQIVHDALKNSIVPMDKFNPELFVYRTFFFLKEHKNFIGQSERFGEFVISIRRECWGGLVDAEPKDSFFRALFRSKEFPCHVFHFIIPELDIAASKFLSMDSSYEKYYKTIVSFIHPKIDYSKLKRMDVGPISDTPSSSKDDLTSPFLTVGSPSSRPVSKIEKALMQLDENKTTLRYKFGLLYICDGQTNESQWFHNNEMTDSFTNFCNIIGQIINLNGHSGFAAGLDTKLGNTGEKSIYTKWKYDVRTQTAVSDSEPKTDDNIMTKKYDEIEFEIMFHTSVLLPFTVGDEQQIQRKRHIGNDLVCVVFIDVQGNISSNSETYDRGWIVNSSFNPTVIKTQFLHVYVVVQEVFSLTSGSDSPERCYRVMTSSTLDVPNFSPYLNDPPLFPVSTNSDKKKFRDFFLSKLINAENAAYESNKFRSLHTRTSIGLIEQLWKDFSMVPETKIIHSRIKPSVAGRRPSATALINNLLSSKKKQNDVEHEEMSLPLGKKEHVSDGLRSKSSSNLNSPRSSLSNKNI